MASRTKSACNEICREVEDTLRATAMVGARIVVGLSGGVDSVVLLHCLSRIASSLELRLSALHIHHGLSPNADGWARFCEELCRAAAVPFEQAQVTVADRSRLGVEAAAREARYAVFSQVEADAVALAHHQDDQAETLLLQLLRGAGVRGLSAMPVTRLLNADTGLKLIRPLLGVRRAQIKAYSAASRLAWVEDETNLELSYERNYLRAEILPRLAQRYPGCTETLTRAAHNLADAAELLDDVAAVDLASTLDGPGVAVSALSKLTPAHARNLLRWVIQQHGLPIPSRDQLEEALRQAINARRDGRLTVKLGAAWLRRHRGHLYLERAQSEVPRGWSQAWCGQAQICLPQGLGRVGFECVMGAGLSVQRLRSDGSVIQPRSGGERMCLAANRPSRTLKNLLQEAGVPQWERDRLPLLFAGSALVWVPGIGIDHRYAAQPDEPGVMPRWVRDE